MHRPTASLIADRQLAIAIAQAQQGGTKDPRPLASEIVATMPTLGATAPPRPRGQRARTQAGRWRALLLSTSSGLDMCFLPFVHRGYPRTGGQDARSA